MFHCHGGVCVESLVENNMTHSLIHPIQELTSSNKAKLDLPSLPLSRPWHRKSAGDFCFQLVLFLGWKKRVSWKRCFWNHGWFVRFSQGIIWKCPFATFPVASISRDVLPANAFFSDWPGVEDVGLLGGDGSLLQGPRVISNPLIWSYGATASVFSKLNLSCSSSPPFFLLRPNKFANFRVTFYSSTLRKLTQPMANL